MDDYPDHHCIGAPNLLSETLLAPRRPSSAEVMSLSLTHFETLQAHAEREGVLPTAGAHRLQRSARSTLPS